MRVKVLYKNYVWTDPKISVLTLGLEQSLSIRSLGINTFDIEVKCRDKAILQFEQNDPIRFFHRRRQLGIAYVQSIKRVSKDHYAISAISALGVLDQTDYMGGIYTGQTVEEVVADICDVIPYAIKTNLCKIKLYGWIGICSRRLALQQVLFAIGANLGTDYNGLLRIETLWDGLSSVIPADNIYQDTGTEQQDGPVTSVTVLEHQYIPGTERKDLYEGTTIEGQRIPFDKPCDRLEADGFAIIESGANYAVVSSGNGKLTGIPYTHATTEITKAVTLAPIPNEERIEDATLVSLVNSNAVAERMVDYYKFRRRITADVVLKRERPGQVVQITHPWDNVPVDMAIESASINVDSILKGTITGLVGFRPAQAGNIDYYDERVVLTGRGQWVPPDGVTEVTVVAIGKGQHGAPGSPGTAGEDSSLWVTTAEADKGGSWNSKASTPGKGGAPGEGGAGGKVYRATIDVTSGTPIDYDATGDEATFGTVSSAAGATYDAGYTDPVTGDVYAAKGKGGVAGGDGGTGGAASQNVAEDGGKGKPVGPYPGGFGGIGYHHDDEDYEYYHYWIRRGGGGGGGGAYGSAIPTQAAGVYGAAGASAKDDAVDQVSIGAGGNGGNGGGGGGGTAAMYYRCTAFDHTNNYLNHPGVAWNAHGGTAGAGSLGTDGGPAGIVIYYRRSKIIRSGVFVTKDMMFLADKFERLIIV